MGISFSCPFAAYSDLENGFQSITVKAISFGDTEVRTPLRSISFKSLDSKATILQSVGSGNMIIEGSVRLETKENETMVSVEAPPPEEKEVCVKQSGTDATYKDNELPSLECAIKEIRQLPIVDASNPKHEAAVKLQKVYKSFRTRRKLADCAVLIEQSWWKLLDFAELKRSSISFFDIEKHETALSRWSRARTRAAKVGKGLSKNGRAQKLALQHWLEAIDPRHRYGHNLQFYYTNWLHCQSKEPFFYWLDIGEGKEVNLVDKCPRPKLHQQCIKYLGPMERKAYEVVVKDGKLYYKQTEELLDTTGPLGVKWIFVLSTSMTLYVGKKIKGTFQHSSFLAGGATSAAGRLVVEKGILKAVWPHSGHYRPTAENFQDFIAFLKGNHVDLADVKMDPVEEEEEEVSFSKERSAFLKASASEDDLSRRSGIEMGEMDVKDLASQKTNSTGETAPALEPLGSTMPSSLGEKLRDLRIPERDDFFESLDTEDEDDESNNNGFEVETPVDGYETADDSFDYEGDHFLNQNLPDYKTKEEVISEESILKRIDSHKGMKSYQLGKQLSSKWSTGAGPRIGCLRDYPSKLQSHALEQVNLSPRGAGCLRSCFSPRPLLYGGKTLAGSSSPMADRANLARRNIRHLRTQSSPLCKATLVTATLSHE